MYVTFVSVCVCVCGCRYQELLHRARTEVFTDLAELNALYRAGRDYLGRSVVVYVGNRFPAVNFDLSRVSCLWVCPHYL